MLVRFRLRTAKLPPSTANRLFAGTSPVRSRPRAEAGLRGGGCNEKSGDGHPRARGTPSTDRRSKKPDDKIRGLAVEITTAPSPPLCSSTTGPERLTCGPGRIGPHLVKTSAEGASSGCSAADFARLNCSSGSLPS